MSEAVYFENFSTNLLIGTPLRSTISIRYLSICKRLNKDFWNLDDNITGGRYIGSFGRNTATGWVSDIDMLFEMPWTLYQSYNSYIGNGQSAFLQAVKNALAKTYPNTTLKGDGQIVSIKFTDGMEIEVLPVFKNDDGSYTFADSNGGGSWKTTNPIPEINTIGIGDITTNYNLRPLCRMTRAWKHYCNVPIKGLLIDTLAYRFLTNWEHRNKSYLYYDLMCRDFFEYLKNQPQNQLTWSAIGSYQTINNPENFRYKSTIAYNKAKEAIKYQNDNMEWSAKQKWKEIYGNRFPN
ncbi:SMODS domain-containing nucleotidyltransferase [Chryseobacterium sp. MYb328]|uniref:SMODS domain-containing nucleotidyltransferase n=1 Tax=Chryseobacterium sp. MYb328 TaxID=2745231 RepID=UPI0030A01F6D